MYIDTHTHLHHRRFDKDRKQVLEQMADVGIQAFLEVAMDLESNAVMREKLREAPMQVRFTAGVHPGAVEKLPEKPDEVLQQIAAYLKDENTVAVGEVGLDLPGGSGGNSGGTASVVPSLYRVSQDREATACVAYPGCT